MGQPISYDERVKIVERVQAGDSYESIALDIGRSEAGVKKIWYAFKKEGAACFQTKYANCGRKPKFGIETHENVAEIRDNEQGASYVYSKFMAKYPKKEAPSPSTLNRWWRLAGTARPKGRPSTKEKKVD